MNTFLRWRGRRRTGEIASAELPESAADSGGFHRVDSRESLRRALGELTAKQRAESQAARGGQAAPRAGPGGSPDRRCGGMSRQHGINAEEQRLADLLKRAVPEPPRQLTYEIAVPHADGPRKPWLIPTLAAAGVVVLGCTPGVVATHSPGNPATPVVPPGASRSSVTAPISATAVPTPTVTAVPTRTPGPVVVPNLVGMSITQAEKAANADGFVVQLQQRAFQHLPSGIVGAQSPPARTGSRYT
ncbi:MAG TPA: PASTA domain-containing protein [Trebonia sp.]|nr:PASTA domain-containing protein [Trebonia sp.]